MNVIPVAKLIGGVFGAIAGNSVVDILLKEMKPANLNTVQKVLWVAGGFIMGGIAAEACSEYVTKTIDQIDEVVGAFRKDEIKQEA